MRLRFAPRILAVCLLFFASHPHGQWQPDGVPIWKRLTSLAPIIRARIAKESGIG